MAISVFPVATSASASGLSKAVNLTSSNTLYTLVDATLTAGNYTVTSPSTIEVEATFYNSSYTSLASGTTASGTASINLPSDASRVTFATTTGSNVAVTLQLTGLILTPNFASAGVETLTSTQTYTQTSTSGYAYVLVVGGGGSGQSRGYYPGGGGGSGGLDTTILPLTGSVATIVGGSGGTTSFGTLTATGGGQPGGGSPNGTGGGGSGYFGGQGGAGSATANVNKYIVNGTTGSGGGGGGKFHAADGGAGAGSGIGTGGNGGSHNASGNSGTGYGAGGGGGGGGPGAGGAGTQGVVYVRRF